jgi:hypothetical protein
LFRVPYFSALKGEPKDAAPKTPAFRVPGRKFVAPSGPVEPVVLTPRKRKRNKKNGTFGGHKVQASLTQLNYANPITRTKVRSRYAFQAKGNSLRVLLKT